jgi:hypothetical protein
MVEDFEADFEKAGRGRASGGAAHLSFDSALKGWRLAPEDKKKEAALAVLANAASLNQKLASLVSADDAEAIRHDAGLT